MNPEQMRAAFANVGYQVPTILCCLISVVIVLVRRKENPIGSAWALLSLGLTILLGVTYPFASSIAVNVAISQELPVSSTLLGTTLAFSSIRGVAYLLMILAVFAGRSPAPTNGPPQAGLPNYYPPQGSSR